MPNTESVSVMNSAELLNAITQADAIYIGVRLGAGGDVVYMKWRDKSDAMRKRVRKMISDKIKEEPAFQFRASVNDVGGEQTVIIGDHIAA